jgi:acyl carrier protein
MSEAAWSPVPCHSIEARVRAVIAASFNLDEDDLPSPASQATIPAWTPRSQMTLLLNLEERFGVSFSLQQVVAMTSAERIAEILTEMIEAGASPS